MNERVTPRATRSLIDRKISSPRPTGPDRIYFRHPGYTSDQPPTMTITSSGTVGEVVDADARLEVSCDVVRRSSRQQRMVRWSSWLSLVERTRSARRVPSATSTLYLADERRSDAADPIYIRAFTSARIELISANSDDPYYTLKESERLPTTCHSLGDLRSGRTHKPD